MTQPADAYVQHQQALAIAIASPPEEARALEGIGRCQLQNDQPAEDAKSLHQALAICQDIGSPDASRVQTLIRNNSL